MQREPAVSGSRAPVALNGATASHSLTHSLLNSPSCSSLRKSCPWLLARPQMVISYGMPSWLMVLIFYTFRLQELLAWKRFQKWSGFPPPPFSKSAYIFMVHLLFWLILDFVGPPTPPVWFCNASIFHQILLMWTLLCVCVCICTHTHTFTLTHKHTQKVLPTSIYMLHQ